MSFSRSKRRSDVAFSKRSLGRLIGTLKRGRAAHRHEHVSLLSGQQAFLDAITPYVIWFGFNGAGKTLALCIRLIRACLGDDPSTVGIKRPLRILICTTGFEAQSTIDIARQLFEIAPKGLFAQVDVDERGDPIGRARPWYAPGRGFRGRPPRLVVQCGPLKGTVINFTTLGAGSEHSAGGTIDIIAVNEPITREVFDELSSRDRVGSLGILWYVFTPTPKAAGQEWVEDVVRDAPTGTMTYVVSALDEGSYSIPTGGDGTEVIFEGQPFRLAAKRSLEPWQKTEARIARWSEHSRPQRMGLSLRPFLDENFFSRVWKADVIHDNPGVGGWLVAGLDYSTKDGRTRVVIAKWWAQGNPRTFWGHVVVDVRATTSDPDTVARELLDELDRLEIPVEAIDAWIGDRAAVADRGLVVRDNLSFRGAMLQEMRHRAGKSDLRAPPALWKIKTPKKRGGSSWASKGFLRALIAHDPPRLRICSYCTAIVEDFESWDGTDRSRFKDGLDALGYGAEVGARHYGLWTATE